MHPLRVLKELAELKIFSSARARRQTITLVGVFVGVLIGAFLIQRRYFPWLTDPAALRVGIESYGIFAPIVFILLQASQVVIAPIPGQVLGFVSGYLFGTLWGTLFSVSGAAIGSYIVFRLSRRYGRSHVERVLEPTLMQQFDGLGERRGLVGLFLVFLVPGLPDDAICFVGGLTRLRIRDMVLVSVLGRFPGYLLMNAAGARFAADRVYETVVIVGVLVGLSVIGYIWRDTILRRITGG